MEWRERVFDDSNYAVPCSSSTVGVKWRGFGERYWFVNKFILVVGEWEYQRNVGVGARVDDGRWWVDKRRWGVDRMYCYKVTMFTLCPSAVRQLHIPPSPIGEEDIRASGRWQALCYRREHMHACIQCRYYCSLKLRANQLFSICGNPPRASAHPLGAVCRHNFLLEHYIFRISQRTNHRSHQT